MALVPGAALARAPIACARGEDDEVDLAAAGLVPDLLHNRQRAVGAGGDHQPAASPWDVLVDSERGTEQPVRRSAAPRPTICSMAIIQEATRC